MAEFQEVIRQYDRMCSHYEECADCPFHKNVIWCIKKIGGKRYVNENAKSVEELIMAWAAQHPEPVYPTWAEYLMHIYQDVSYARILGETIPADIAEKLGLQPKEG